MPMMSRSEFRRRIGTHFVLTSDAIVEHPGRGDEASGDAFSFPTAAAAERGRKALARRWGDRPYGPVGRAASVRRMKAALRVPRLLRTGDTVWVVDPRDFARGVAMTAFTVTRVHLRGATPVDPAPHLDVTATYTAVSGRLERDGGREETIAFAYAGECPEDVELRLSAPMSDRHGLVRGFVTKAAAETYLRACLAKIARLANETDRVPAPSATA